MSAPTGSNGPRADVTIVARWTGKESFDAGRPGGPTARLDGTGASGQSPVDALLSALTVCTAIDVVDILAKRRTPPDRCEIVATAERRPEPPRRIQRVRLEFQVDGAMVERVHAERAIALSLEKYCSVGASIAGDVVIETRLTLNGQACDVVRQPTWSAVNAPRG